MEDFVITVFGDLSAGMWFAYLFFVVIGTSISLLTSIMGRDKNSSSSPAVFSWTFFWRDNWMRIITVFLLVFVTIRFYNELTGTELTAFLSLGIGFAHDRLISWVRKTGIGKVFKK